MIIISGVAHVFWPDTFLSILHAYVGIYYCQLVICFRQMDNLPIQQAQQLMVNNVVYIEFLNKKNFPPGHWMAEPDLCQWENYGLVCLTIRDMKLGMWRGFVALTQDHIGFGKPLEELILEPWGLNLQVHGGVSVSGKLPSKYKDFNKDKWWIGFECGHGEDLLPLVKLDSNDPIDASIMDNQSYKDIHFVRRETNRLAKQLAKVK